MPNTLLMLLLLLAVVEVLVLLVDLDYLALLSLGPMGSAIRWHEACLDSGHGQEPRNGSGEAMSDALTATRDPLATTLVKR